MRLIIDVRLCEVEDPVIWRKVAIPIKLTFDALHLILQAAMGWDNEHLYSFKETRRSRYMLVVSPYAEEFGIDGTRVSASEVLWSYSNQFVMPKEPRDKLYYEYDYGDGWLHEIDVMELDRSDRVSAELLDGEGACPPENCGGVPGYQRMKEYLAGKMSKGEYYNWMSAPDAEYFDPNAFNLERTKVSVKTWKLQGE